MCKFSTKGPKGQDRDARRAFGRYVFLWGWLFLIWLALLAALLLPWFRHSS